MRPVGQHIRAVMAILDDGPQTYRQVWEQRQSVDKCNVRKYLSRAVGLGLATCDRDAYPMTFTAIEGWRVIVDKRPKAIRPAPAPLSRRFGAHNPFGCFFAESGLYDKAKLSTDLSTKCAGVINSNSLATLGEC